ncbi:hypothetical protein AMELA_G00183260 [Ameiurus melas]|uniref:Uncharacterized protein n=1 Tax=Ameiurus melas TaxID=219545 RepID=A0A7J6ACR6_AMEME|nr:hypothetical protein AMELA_G00183260 [Ameiurus melas]
MCIDVMVTEGRKQRESRSSGWWRRRKTTTTGVVKAAARKSSRRSGRRSLPVKEKQKQADALPSGAMAPRNTTQYLMELVYSDLNITAPYSPPRHGNACSCNSQCTNEDTMDFQHRDFESKSRNLPPLNLIKTKRHACAVGGSWLCVMCRCLQTELSEQRRLWTRGRKAPGLQAWGNSLIFRSDSRCTLMHCEVTVDMFERI